MDYQSKQKQGRQQPNEQKIFKAICDFHSSGITTDEFCQMYEIDEVTLSWNTKYKKLTIRQ